MENIKKFLDYLRIISSDLVAGSIATWTFVFIYTGAMILWIILHNVGILHIDSQDFIKYNLFLSWAAGIQASIILMVSNREGEKDRKTLLKGVELDQKTLKYLIKSTTMEKISNEFMNEKVMEMLGKLQTIEEIIHLMEKEEGMHDDTNNKK